MCERFNATRCKPQTVGSGSWWINAPPALWCLVYTAHEAALGDQAPCCLWETWPENASLWTFPPSSVSLSLNPQPLFPRDNSPNEKTLEANEGNKLRSGAHNGLSRDPWRSPPIHPLHLPEIAAKSLSEEPLFKNRKALKMEFWNLGIPLGIQIFIACKFSWNEGRRYRGPDVGC